MRNIPFQKKQTKGLGYWGEYNEIPLGLSSGEIRSPEDFQSEKLHWHEKGLSYFIGIEGVGIIEVNGVEVQLKKDDCLEILPGEKYRVIGASQLPFKWVVICTQNTEHDKVIDT